MIQGGEGRKRWASEPVGDGGLKTDGLYWVWIEGGIASYVIKIM